MPVPTRSRGEHGIVANGWLFPDLGDVLLWRGHPRPAYYADGHKKPDCWTWPPSLHDSLVAELGPFPLFTFWVRAPRSTAPGGSSARLVD